MEFKDRLKKYRADNNLTQEELAEKLFVSRQAISKYETGRGYPSYEILTTIASLLEISVNELISREELAKETINTAVQTQKNKRSLFMLLGAVAFVVILSIAAIVLSVHNSTRIPHAEKGNDLIGMVATTDPDRVSVESLTNNELAGYCFLYDKTSDGFTGSAFNVTSLDMSVTEFANRFEMTVMLSAKERILYFYEIYFDGEAKEYIFAESCDFNLDTANKLEAEFQRDGITWKFVFNIKRVDELLDMKLYEFGLNGKKLSERAYGGETQYTISPDCLYLVIEEKLKDDAGRIYFNREVIYNADIDKLYLYNVKLISGNNFGNKQLIIFKYDNPPTETVGGAFGLITVFFALCENEYRGQYRRQKFGDDY